MSTLPRQHDARHIGASVRERPSVVKPRRVRRLESLGRKIVARAISRVATGRITIADQTAGSELRSHAATGPVVRVHIHDPAFYTAAAFGGSVGIAESYIEGDWTTNDLPALIEIITANIAAMDALEGRIASLLAPLARAAYWLDRNTRAGSKRNIVAHYDLGNDFFALFLDPTMSYSSAVFENGADTLEAAQIEKIDRACRKLELSPTDHLLEIGTGWGALAIHAATRYGCQVTTTTISEEQHRLATQRVHEAGLQDRITVLKQDYRDLTGQFDKLVSVEMVEAVGAERYADYFDVCSRCLKPDGAALIQAIVIRDQYFERAARRRDFLKKYIFPGSCLPSIGAMLQAVDARTDLRTWHLEDFAPHYATTLRLWRQTFLSKIDDVRAQGFDERFIRMWDYYLAYCEGAYRARHVGVIQWLLTKPDCRIRTASAPAAGTA